MERDVQFMVIRVRAIVQGFGSDIFLSLCVHLPHRSCTTTLEPPGYTDEISVFCQQYPYVRGMCWELDYMNRFDGLLNKM